MRSVVVNNNKPSPQQLSRTTGMTHKALMRRSYLPLLASRRRLVPELRCTGRLQPPWTLHELKRTATSIPEDAPSPVPMPLEEIRPRILIPHIHSPHQSSWVATTDHLSSAGPVERGTTIKVASWNVDAFTSDPAARIATALTHLSRVFGESPGNLVVMLQEVCTKSLDAILHTAWVQNNFALSNIESPKALVLDKFQWRPHEYFTLIMVSRTLPTSRCFRVPFVTDMGRDALFVDIPTQNPTGSKESLRLCTTHLESLGPGLALRLGQLAMISQLLRGAQPAEWGFSDTDILGGLVGGDMNATDNIERSYHQEPEVSLKDVWEDEPAPIPPVLRPFQKDLTYGLARGNTWGYQNSGKGGGSGRKRFDKFYYTGSVQTCAVHQGQDCVGRIGRFGIGIKTKVTAWELRAETPEAKSPLEKTKRWKKTEQSKKNPVYISDELALTMTKAGVPGVKLTRQDVDIWVSDHFGIVTGVKIRGESAPSLPLYYKNLSFP